MRSVTSHLNKKLTSTQQTPANKADPKMSIRVSRARTTVMDSDYWTVETIRTADNLGDISLAARRRVPYGSPDSIYEIHIEGGIVKTSIRKYPDYFKLGWVQQFELGEGSAVAIAFNGNWQLHRRKWRLATDEKPFIFWVDSDGVLWSQLWDLSETKRQISSSVTKVKAIRGWKNVNFPDKDQGIIVSYIKTDGKVYYSSYCQTVDFTNVWEPERQHVFEPVETIRVYSPYSAGIEHIFHDVYNKFLWIANLDDGNGDWGRTIQFETLYPMHELQVVNLFLEDMYFGMVIPVGGVTHLGGNKYQASVSEETLVGMNNAQGSVRLTIKNLKTQLGLMMDDFFIEFTPVNLVPIEIPLPVVEEVWNE